MSWSCTGGSGKNQEPGAGGRGPGTRDRGPGAKRRGPGAGAWCLSWTLWHRVRGDLSRARVERVTWLVCGHKKSGPLGAACCFVVPGAGFEPAHLSATVFETVVSAVPPPGRMRIYAV